MAADISSLGRIAFAKAGAALSVVDQCFQHVNTYRALTYRVSRYSGSGARQARMAKFSNDCLGDFDTHDQDKFRVDWARKLQLARCSQVLAVELNNAMAFAGRAKVTNLALLHELARTRLIIFGEKSPADALSYARRSTLKLHPDRTHDLAGWSMPGARYLSRPNAYQFEHARHGASALFSLHCGMSALLGQPHYAKKLYSNRVLRGGSLTIPQLLSDASVATALGALVAVVRGSGLAKVLYVSGLTYAVLLSALACMAIGAATKRRNAVQCREMVVYRPFLAI